MDPLQQIAFEWVLTNGCLPGFEERLHATKHLWSKTQENMVVWRGQGTTKKKGIPGLEHPHIVLGNVRPVISTSTDYDSAHEYSGEECCVFKITVLPGVRYINIKNLFSDDINSDLIEHLKTLIPEDQKGFISRKTTSFKMVDLFIKRKNDENEILLESGGIFTEPNQIGNSPVRFSVYYSAPKAGGRRSIRTRRRKMLKTRRIRRQ
jgi:hypothetical protein